RMPSLTALVPWGLMNFAPERARMMGTSVVMTNLRKNTVKVYSPRRSGPPRRPHPGVAAGSGALGHRAQIGAVGQQGLEIQGRHGPGKQIALAVITTGRRQQLVVRTRLDALGHHTQAQFVRQQDDGLA